MTFKELKPLLMPEERCIFRIYSSGNKIIDSGAVVLMNLNDALDDAEIKLVYVAECIEHIDLLVSDETFEHTNWEQVFGKEIYQSRTPDFPSTPNYPDEF